MILDHVDNMGPALNDLVDQLDRNARFPDHFAGTFSRQNFKPGVVKIPDNRYGIVLIFPAQAEHDPAGPGDGVTRRILGFLESFAKTVANAHNLTGTFHFRTKHGVHSRKFDERKNRFFNRIKVRRLFIHNTLFSQRLPCHAS